MLDRLDEFRKLAHKEDISTECTDPLVDPEQYQKDRSEINSFMSNAKDVL